MPVSSPLMDEEEIVLAAQRLRIALRVAVLLAVAAIAAAGLWAYGKSGYP